MPVAYCPEISRLTSWIFPRPAWENNMPLAYCAKLVPMSTELVSRLEVAGYDIKSHFVMRWLFFYFVLLPGLRPSAVSVGCSTSTKGLVLQDAFAYGVLTNRLTPLGYASKDRKLPVKTHLTGKICYGVFSQVKKI